MRIADLGVTVPQGPGQLPQEITAQAQVVPASPQITADLLSNGIDVYPQKEFDEDAEDRQVNEKFRVSTSA